MFDDLLPGLNNLCIDFFSTKRPVTFIREGMDEFSLKGIFDNNYISVDPDSGQLKSMCKLSLLSSLLKKLFIQKLTGFQVSTS